MSEENNENRPRRDPGTGGVYSYETKRGTRWFWKANLTVNGRRKPVMRRG
jgi:hypothetical protein